MAELTDEPRAYPRYEVDAFVDCTGQEVALYHRVQNISLGGICIQSSGAEEIGTTVELVINFPELASSLAVRGQVVWVNRAPPTDMGIRFVDLDGERKETLKKYIGMVKQA
jgi:uncharacterized protein (TIGR02266 family)